MDWVTIGVILLLVALLIASQALWGAGGHSACGCGGRPLPAKGPLKTETLWQEKNKSEEPKEEE